MRALLPDLWELVAPRRGLLALGMVLMAVNRVSGLVLVGLGLRLAAAER